MLFLLFVPVCFLVLSSDVIKDDDHNVADNADNFFLFVFHCTDVSTKTSIRG